MGISFFGISSNALGLYLDGKNWTLVTNGDSVLFVSDVSSQVVACGTDTVSYGSWERHYAFQGGKAFFVKDVLYSIGGYGYWRINPFLLKYNRNSGWEALQIIGDYTPVVPAGVVTIDNFVLVIGGKKLKEGSLVRFTNHPYLQRLDINDRRLSKQMRLEFLSDDQLTWYQEGSTVLFVGEGVVGVLDVDNWTFYQSEIDADLMQSIRKIESWEVKDNKIVLNNQYEIILENQFNEIGMYLGLIPLFFFGLLLIIYYRRLKDEKLLENKGTSKQPFDVTRLFLDLKLKQSLRHVYLYDYFSIDYSQSYKNKIIRQKITELNAELVRELKLVANPVERIIDELDRRSVSYRLGEFVNDEVFERILVYLKNEAELRD